MSVRISDLTFRYQGTEQPTLKNLSIEVGKGEMLFLLGANGSGKSTLFSCLAGLIPQFEPGELTGRIFIGEEEVLQASKEPQVGFLLQDSDVYLFEEVHQEISYPLLNSGRSEGDAEQLVHEIAIFLKIEHLLYRQMATLSGGERQKIALAVTLASDHDVLLLDEPLEQLDADAAYELLGSLKILAQQGKSIIISARRLDYVVGYADKLAVLEDGGITVLGDTAEVLPTVSLGRNLQRNLKNNKEQEAAVPSDGKVRSCQSIPLVEVKNLSYSFTSGGGGLSGIDLQIYPGEVFAIMGPNGAGKSTLIKHFLGLLKPQSGSVMVLGQDTAVVPTHKLAHKVGLVLQNPADQIFNERVDKEIAWTLKARGWKWPAAMEQAEKIMSELDMIRLADKHPYALSRAERQLVSLASVLIAQPDLILLDEPTKGMDDQLVEQVMNSLVRLHKGGSVILVTHDPAVTWAYADRTAILVAGRLAGVGRTSEVFADRALLEEAQLARHPFITRPRYY